MEVKYLFEKMTKSKYHMYSSLGETDRLIRKSAEIDARIITFSDICNNYVKKWLKV